MCSRYRARQRGAGRAIQRPKQAGRKRRATRKTCGRATASQASKSRKPPRGGPWRALVSQESKFKKGRAAFKVLSERYKVLPLAEKRRLEEAGRSARVAAQGRIVQGSACGPSSRQAHRDAVKRRRLALSEVAAENETRPEVAGGKGNPQAAQAFTASAPGDLVRIEPHVTAARRTMLSESALKRLREHRECARVQAFQSGAGAQSLSQLCEHADDLRTVSQYLQPLPDNELKCFEFAPETAEMSARLASRVRSEGATTNLGNALSSLWSLRSHTILQSVCPAISPAPEAAGGAKAAARNERCRCAGMCLHHCPEGRQLLQIEGRYLSVLRRFFGRGKPHRALIGSGCIVARILFGEGADDEWLHIGMHYYSTVRSTMQLLAVQAGREVERLGAGQPIRLEACVWLGGGDVPVLFGASLVGHSVFSTPIA